MTTDVRLIGRHFLSSRYSVLQDHLRKTANKMEGKRRVLTKMILVVIVLTLVGIMMRNRAYFTVDGNQATLPVLVERNNKSMRSEVIQIRDPGFEETDVTIVTAYFDIGRFPKGSVSNMRNSDVYYKWANIFKYIQNNLVVFTDSEVFRDKMLLLRESLKPKTKIMSVKKEEAWPFQNLGKIATIFNSTSYPKFYPNTVYPLYSCITHAKLYLLEIAAKEDFFGTKYIMWLDAGYFRNRKSKALFYLSRPKGFNESKIAVTQVYQKIDFKVSPETIIKRNKNAVAGGLLFGEKHQMLKFTNQFKDAVNYFLEQNLTNTEQQIIYAMFSEKGRQILKPEVHLQMYKSNKSVEWFYLGYYMIKET